MVVRINEDKLHLLKEDDEEITFYEFFVNAKSFLKDLLTKAVDDSSTPELFKRHNISREDLINKMKDLDIIRTKENITEVPKNDGSGKLRAKHTIQYIVCTKRFGDKMKELHKEIFG